MNIQAYIESGILELYVAGTLSEREMAEVHRLSKQYPEIRSEIESIEEAMFLLADSGPHAPKAGMRDRIMSEAKLNAAPVLRQAPAITPSPVETVTDIPVVPVRSNQALRWALAACIALLVLSNSGTFMLWNSWKSAKIELEALKEENRQSNRQLASLRSDMNETSQTLTILRNPDFIKLKLKGMPLSPASEAVVHWNKTTHKVMIDPMNLPQTDGKHDYQLWALVNGKPVDLGIFSPQEGQHMFEMKGAENAQAFAVTLEPKGGSVNPTLEQMYLMGQI